MLSLGYRPDAFTEAYPDGTCAGVRLHYAVEPEPLDTAGAIRFAAEHAGIAERFVVVNGDVLTDLDVGAFLEFHCDRGAEATIALHPVEDPSAYGVVPTDRDGRVSTFVEKPPRHEAPTNLINAGTYVLEPSVLDRIPPGRRVSVERETFPAVAADGRLYATDGRTYWIDTGTPATYLAAQLHLVDGVRGAPADGVAPAASVDDGATVVRSVIGPEAVVEAGAEVRDSVLFPGSVIRPGAAVRSSIVANRAKVGEWAVLADTSVLGDDEIAAPGEELRGVRRPDPSAG